MKFLKNISIMMLALTSLNTFAEDTQEFYAGVGVVKNDLRDADARYNEINFKIMAGTKITDNFATEMQLVNFAEEVVTSDSGVSTTVEGNIFGISGLYYFIKEEDIIFQPFVKLGVHVWDINGSSNSNGFSDGDGVDLFGGAGVDFVLGDLTTRVEYENYDIDNNFDNDIDSVSASAILNF